MKKHLLYTYRVDYNIDKNQYEQSIEVRQVSSTKEEYEHYKNDAKFLKEVIKNKNYDDWSVRNWAQSLVLDKRILTILCEKQLSVCQKLMNEIEQHIQGLNKLKEKPHKVKVRDPKKVLKEV